jgi:hypothetical protein
MGTDSDNTDNEPLDGALTAVCVFTTDGHENEPNEVDDAECPVLVLDSDGLFLNLLGLKVDSDTLDLSVTAVPGDANPLGNLLCALLGNPFEGVVSGAVDRLRALLSEVVDALPIEEIVSRLAMDLVEQLLDGSGS